MPRNARRSPHRRPADRRRPGRAGLLGLAAAAVLVGCSQAQAVPTAPTATPTATATSPASSSTSAPAAGSAPHHLGRTPASTPSRRRACSGVITVITSLFGRKGMDLGDRSKGIEA